MTTPEIDLDTIIEAWLASLPEDDAPIGHKHRATLHPLEDCCPIEHALIMAGFPDPFVSFAFAMYGVDGSEVWWAGQTLPGRAYQFRQLVDHSGYRWSEMTAGFLRSLWETAGLEE